MDIPQTELEQRRPATELICHLNASSTPDAPARAAASGALEASRSAIQVVAGETSLVWRARARATIVLIMDVREVDWSTAEVTDKRTLTVALAGESDARWCGAFTTAAGLLDAASHNHLWGEVAARARKAGDQIIVNQLEINDPDHVKSLHEFVDAVARQASSGAPVAEGSADDGHGDNPAANSTRAFRALAPDGQTASTS